MLCADFISQSLDFLSPPHLISILILQPHHEHRWGYTGESYASKLGPQMVTFDAMRNHLTAAASLADVSVGAEPIDPALFV